MNKKSIRFYTLLLSLAFLIPGSVGLIYTDWVSKSYEPVVAKVQHIKKYKVGAGRKATTQYDATITYRVDDTTYKTLLKKCGPSMKKGDHIEVYYNPQKPGKVVSVELNKSMWFMFLYLALITFVCGSVLFILSGIFSGRSVK